MSKRKILVNLYVEPKYLELEPKQEWVLISESTAKKLGLWDDLGESAFGYQPLTKKDLMHEVNVAMRMLAWLLKEVSQCMILDYENDRRRFLGGPTCLQRTYNINHAWNEIAEDMNFTDSLPKKFILPDEAEFYNVEYLLRVFSISKNGSTRQFIDFSTMLKKKLMELIKYYDAEKITKDKNFELYYKEMNLLNLVQNHPILIRIIKELREDIISTTLENIYPVIERAVFDGHVPVREVSLKELLKEGYQLT